MAEAGIGLAASLITLATLFKSCLDCFEFYKAAEDCEGSLETVLVELDCEKERLLIWAEAIGLVQLEKRKRHLHIEKHEKVIKAALEQIRNLLDNATKLQERYGVKVFDDSNTITAATTDPISKNLAMTFKIAYRRFTSKLNHFNGNNPSLTMQIRWAIRDRAKFMGLIVTLKGFVDRLFQIIPISREVQDSMVEADIFSIMDLSQLRLVEAACEGSYRAWSDIASNAIDRTERETINQRTHTDDREQGSHISPWFSQANKARTTTPESICQDGWTDKYAFNCLKLFATIEDCDSFTNPSPCSNQNFRLLSTEYPIYLAERYDRWNLGRRLVAEIDWSLFHSEEINNVYKNDQDDRTGAFVDIRIYVAPCKRQISTAIGICTSVLLSKKPIDCYIRIDDRLSASCCSRSGVSERLKLLLSELKERNNLSFGLFDQERFETIDRLWLEQRLYEIDGDTDRDPIILETQLSDHLRSVYDCTGLSKPLAAILLIGESHLINKVINTQPFYASPRVPEPNEFFRIDTQFFVAMGGYRYVRKFLGSIDVNPNHKKAQAPTLPVSPPASRSWLKRGSEADSGVDSYVKRIKTQSEPESEDLHY